MSLSPIQGPVGPVITTVAAAPAAPQKYGEQYPKTMVGKIEAITNPVIKAVAFFFYAVFNVVFVLLPLLFDHIINGTKPIVSDTLEPAIDTLKPAIATLERAGHTMQLAGVAYIISKVSGKATEATEAAEAAYEDAKAAHNDALDACNVAYDAFSALYKSCYS